MIIVPFNFNQAAQTCTCVKHPIAPISTPVLNPVPTPPSPIEVPLTLPEPQRVETAASPGANLSQKEIVSLSNLDKDGNWIIGSIRALFLLHALGLSCVSAKRSLCGLKKAICGQSSHSKLKLGELFNRVVGLAVNAASICVWADQVKVISLGRAAFHVNLAYYGLEFLRRVALATATHQSADKAWKRYHRSHNAGGQAASLSLLAIHQDIAVLHALCGIYRTAQGGIPHRFVNNLETLMWVTGTVQALFCSMFKETKKPFQDVVIAVHYQ